MLIALVLVGFLACASPAPRYRNDGASSSFYDYIFDNTSPFDDDFLGGNFLNLMVNNTALTNVIRSGGPGTSIVIGDINNYDPCNIANEAMRDDLYKITMTVSGFNVKDIVVKVNGRQLTIHAHNKISHNDITSTRTLPTCVSAKGKWTYENGILQVKFPFNGKEGTLNTGFPTE